MMIQHMRAIAVICRWSAAIARTYNARAFVAGGTEQDDDAGFISFPHFYYYYFIRIYRQ